MFLYTIWPVYCEYPNNFYYCYYYYLCVLSYSRLHFSEKKLILLSSNRVSSVFSSENRLVISTSPENKTVIFSRNS